MSKLIFSLLLTATLAYTVRASEYDLYNLLTVPCYQGFVSSMETWMDQSAQEIQIEVTCNIDGDLVVFGDMTLNPLTNFYPARFQEDPELYRRRFDFEREDGSYKCPREIITEVQLMIGSVFSKEEDVKYDECNGQISILVPDIASITCPTC